ncbi:MAG: epoxyqueuosine reductase [Desulfobacterales bacterium]|nr:epoxyqueuosine reductase [Desulfobacterales bacterium]
MTEINLTGREIIAKAIEFGASLAGIVNIDELKFSPSHTIYGKMPDYSGVGTVDVEGKEKQGQVQWDNRARSAVVIAVAHPEDEPDLDYWVQGLSGGTRGNAKLISVFSRLAGWVEKEKNIGAIKIPYYVEQGGVFVKDAAVLAGLGCIGRNNILVTPEYGPRVRLRVLFLAADLPSTGIKNYDPCGNCEQFCKKACPMGAMGRTVYTAEKMGQDLLPGRNGTYNRKQCNRQMEKDINNGEDVPVPGTDKTGSEVRFCRQCELACPVGLNDK